MADIPRHIQEFVERSIFSVSELEILLYLRDHAAEPCDVAMIGRSLLMHRPAVEPRLEALRTAGLATASEAGGVRKYQYAPPPELAALVDELSMWYASHPVTITTLIFSKPIDRIISGFAESFRLRQKEDK